MKLQRKVYLTLEVEFDTHAQDYPTNRDLVDNAIDQGLDKMENWLYGLDEVQHVRFVDVEFK